MSSESLTERDTEHDDAVAVRSCQEYQSTNILNPTATIAIV